jgi:hypothetical protein
MDGITRPKATEAEVAEHEATLAACRRISLDNQSLVKGPSPKKLAFNAITDALEAFPKIEQQNIIRAVVAYYELGTLED